MAFMANLFLDEERDVISSHDSAIDPETSEVAVYVREGYPPDWERLLHVLPGQTLTIWRIRPLSAEVRSKITTRHTSMRMRQGGEEGQEVTIQANTLMLHLEIFAAGVVGWSGLSVHDRQGRIREIQPEFTQIGKTRILSEKTMNTLICLVPRVVAEIAQVIRAEASLPDEAKN